MLAVELLALVLLLGALTIVIRLVWNAVQRSGERVQERRRRQSDMEEDLRAALKSGDYRCLDDFMVMWGSLADDKTFRHVRARRDELYLNSEADS
jgi:hypothetical protein